jgi:hypothetical protein
MQNLLALKQEFTKQGILITFNGPFTHSIIEELGKAAKTYLEGEHLDRGVITDVFAVYIEQTQNVSHYVKRNNLMVEGRDSAVVVISTNPDSYCVSAGNYILHKDVPGLEARFQELQNLDKAELKKLYKTQLRKDRDPAAQGAGLGLIDMARRSSEPIQFSFDKIDEEYSFFTLIVTVSGV